MIELKSDIIIIGGGIAGLWLHHRLNDLGYYALLIENKTLGNAQTLSSQGIIHGGAKYSLNGILSGATSAISDMPTRWLNCFKGTGEIDLSNTTVLTDNQLMWSTQSLSSKLTSFFSSKALNGHMQPLTQTSLPQFFKHPEFKGNLYQLNEPVVDVPSLLKNLSQTWQKRIFCINEEYELIFSPDGKIEKILIDNKIELQAKKIILSSGEGNEFLLERFKINTPKMQRRPLHMVLAKGKKLPELYAHCIGASTKPLATITTHAHSDGHNVWYIGGNIAEEGAQQSKQALINHSKKTLGKLLPWFEMNDIEWETHNVNRAEPAQKSLLRPDTAFLAHSNNVYITWPTKLALTPNLADQVIEQLKKESISPSEQEEPLRQDTENMLHTLHPIQFSPSLWDRAFDAKN
jgi:glycerol-3-phosphate dehydrogenase